MNFSARWNVTDTSDSATDTGSLRHAIANAANGDTIHFNIPTSDPGYDAVTGSWTITPSSTLSVNTSIIIDGTSQPGFTRGGHPVIVLNGRNASASDGIDLNTDGCTVEGLVINDFDQGAGVSMVSSNSTIRANYIGTDVTGTVDMGNRDGIVVNGNFNLIGTEGQDSTTAPDDRNLIAFNHRNGVSLSSGARRTSSRGTG